MGCRARHDERWISDAMDDEVIDRGARVARRNAKWRARTERASAGEERKVGNAEARKQQQRFKDAFCNVRGDKRMQRKFGKGG
eukprot:6208452-Pleurochrysis_carterae.AAC.1